MFLPRIQTKDVEFEEKHAGEWIHDLPQNHRPPCVDEKVAFMSCQSITQMKNHPYAEFEDQYDHYLLTPLKYPAYSFLVIPYNWMLKDKATKENEKARELNLYYDLAKEPQLKFSDQWVQHKDNQKPLLDAFASAFVPDQSLIFIYAKNIPFIDRIDRVLIGVTSVKSVGNLTEYRYDQKNPVLQSVFWERPVYHGLNPSYNEGFLLPYSELMNIVQDMSQEEIEQYIAFAPNFEQFSYGSELVSHDTAIDALISLRNALTKMAPLVGGLDAYTKQLDWLNEQVSRLWNMRGAFPGLGAVLTAMKVPEGNIVAWEIEKYLWEKEGENPTTNPWEVIEEIFQGNASWLRSDLQRKIGKSFHGMWNSLDGTRKEYLKLLSRLAITNAQAEDFYSVDSETRYLKNMYLFFEESVLSSIPIGLDVVDKAVYLTEDLRTVFPLPATAQPDGVHDIRRIRAFVVECLEKASVNGHSLQTQDQVITAINANDTDTKLEITRDILNYAESGFEHKVVVVNVDEQEEQKRAYKYYKLHRSQEHKEIILQCVQNRVYKARRIKLEKNWREIVDQKLVCVKEGQPTWKIEKDERAKVEKAAALDEISRSRFSVIVGPAGTGKTTLLNMFCDQPEIKNTGVLKLAPTGKARVNLGQDAKTIAQFLSRYQRYDGVTGRYYTNQRAPRYAEAKTVIIDESSMLTEEQFAAVLDAIVDYDRLIIVGDPRQLPPIGVGKPLVEIVNFLKPDIIGTPLVGKGYAELQEVFRQSDENEVKTDDNTERIDIRLSRWFSDSLIRKEGEDIFDELAMHPTKDLKNLKLIQWYNTSDLEGKILSAIKDELGLESEDDSMGFDKYLGANDFKGETYFRIGAGKIAEKWQILSPVNANGFGTKEINRLIQKTFHSKKLELALNPPKLHLGPNFSMDRVRRIPEPVGTDNMVYGDKVINLRNTKWDKNWHYINNSGNKDTMKYFANGEIGIITGQFRGYSFLKKHYSTPRQKRRYLPPPAVEVEFSSQPGYAYQIKTTEFSEDGDIQFELAYAVTVHKSQGSGFITVFLILPNPCGLLSRELLYTALTRQEYRIIIFHQGDFKDFKKYISDGYSETGRRLTDIFSTPVLREIQKRHYDSNYVQVSAHGEFMISKSEVIIADQLFYQNVPYAYEQAITDDRGITIHPDFTVDNKELGVVFYWEHLGMLANDEYRKKWERKEGWYARNNIVHYTKATQDDDRILITTKDKPDGGIDSQEVKQIIEKEIKGM